MKELWTRFWTEEDGLGTVEIVVIIAVLITIALIFRRTIVQYVENMTDTLFGKDGNDGKNIVSTTGKEPTSGSGGAGAGAGGG